MKHNRSFFRQILWCLLAIAGLCLGLAFTAAAQGGESPSRPGFRALWVPRWGLADPSWTAKMVADAANAGFSDLFVQVNGRGETYYRSDILPPAEDLSPGYDPLTLILDEAHKRGLAVHAWVNAFTIGLPNRKPLSPFHPLNKHPDWITYDSKGASLLAWPPERARNLEGYYLDPGVPAVQDYVVSVVTEVVARYPLDGIHLDYIRYPGRDYGYHPVSRGIFRASTGVDPLDLVTSLGVAPQGGGLAGADKALSARWDQWRRDQVSALLRRVALSVRAARPGIAVSAAVFPDLSEAVEERMQDWPAWLAAGDLDFVVMMAYTTDTGLVLKQLDRARRAVPGAKIYPGLGAYKFGASGVDFLKQVGDVLATSPEGVSVYSYQSLLDMPNGLGALGADPSWSGKSIQNPVRTAPAN